MLFTSKFIPIDVYASPRFVYKSRSLANDSDFHFLIVPPCVARSATTMPPISPSFFLLLVPPSTSFLLVAIVAVEGEAAENSRSPSPLPSDPKSPFNCNRNLMMERRSEGSSARPTISKVATASIRRRFWICESSSKIRTIWWRETQILWLSIRGSLELGLRR